MEPQTEPKSDTLKELAKIRAETRAQASSKQEEPKAEDLPPGKEPVGSPPPKDEPAPVAAAPESPATPATEEEDGPVVLNGQSFKNTAEALAYAEKLEQEKLILEAHNEGMRDALQYGKAPVVEAPAVPTEDNFDAEFYTDPKKKFAETEDKAVQKALAIMRAEKAEEKAWQKFAALHPDLADSRREVMQVLEDNKEYLNKVKDMDKAMGILATKTRAYFDQIVERRKPRTELPARQAQVVSPAGGSPQSVTPAKKDDAPLTMAQQMKKLRGR